MTRVHLPFVHESVGAGDPGDVAGFIEVASSVLLGGSPPRRFGGFASESSELKLRAPCATMWTGPLQYLSKRFRVPRFFLPGQGTRIFPGLSHPRRSNSLSCSSRGRNLPIPPAPPRSLDHLRHAHRST